MAFNVGSFVDGMFGGLKAGQDFLKARNDLKIQMAEIEFGEAARAQMQRDAAGNPTPAFDYGGGGDIPGTSGSSTPPTELPSDDVKGGVRRGAGGSGTYAQIAIETARGAGASDAAIQGMMANGLGEGGFQESWKKAGGGENSFGHWQFNRNGELPGYLNFVKKEGGDPTDTRLQTLYALKRANEVHPGFSQLTDAKTATDVFATRFERYKGAAPGQRYGLLTDAQRYMTGQPVEPRQAIPVGPKGYTGDEPTIPAGPRGYGSTTSGGVPEFTGGRASALGAPAEVPAAPSSGMGTGLAAPTGALPPNALNVPAKAPLGRGQWRESPAVSPAAGAGGSTAGGGQRITVPPPSPLNVSSAPAPVPPPIKPVSGLGIGGNSPFTPPSQEAAFPATGGSNLFAAPRRAPDGREYVPGPQPAR